MNPNYIAQHCTAIIKTFERPDKLCALVDSIRRYYPLLPIVIVDDSAKKMERQWDAHTAYYPIAYDVGVSEGRNIAVRQVKTPYTLLLDDDFYFTKNTKIEVFLDILESDHFDLVAGELIDYGTEPREFQGDFKMVNRKLFMRYRPSRKINERRRRFDFASNFFLAKTDLLKQSPWDPELKIREHEEFYWRLKKRGARITCVNEVAVFHYPDEPEDKKNTLYNEMRHGRSLYFRRMACQKMGVEDFFGGNSLCRESFSLFKQYANGVKWIESNKQKKRSAQLLWHVWQPTRPIFQLVYRCWKMSRAR